MDSRKIAPPAATLPLVGRRRVLVVDDEADIAKILSNLLERMGHIAITASDGEEGLAIVKEGKEKFDLVITDLRMPRLDGYGLLKALKEMEVAFEIIVITGFASMDLFIDAIREGASDFVLKPIDRDQFRLAVSRALEKKALKESLLDRTRILLQSEKMASLGLLATGVAHEINNPNTFIRTNLQLMQEYIRRMGERFSNLEEPENRAFVEKVVLTDFPYMIGEAVKGSERIEKIVSGIRHYGHQGEEPLDAWVDLREVLTEAINLSRARIGKRIVITENYGERRACQGSFSRLEQVFVNLIMNAVDAIQEREEKEQGAGNADYSGVIDVSITGERTDEGDFCLVTIYDNAGGIGEDKIDKVFDPFFTTKPVGVGTGLGLFIVYEIIASHLGEIVVKSAPNEGTAFIIRLPACKVADDLPPDNPGCR